MIAKKRNSHICSKSYLVQVHYLNSSIYVQIGIAIPSVDASKIKLYLDKFRKQMADIWHQTQVKDMVNQWHKCFEK